MGADAGGSAPVVAAGLPPLRSAGLPPLRSVGWDVDLALSSPADIDRARGLVDALVLAARTMLASAQHDPDVAQCDAAGCGFARTDHPELCPLAHQLAGSAACLLEPPPFAVALDAFAAALTRSIEAVGVCRRTAHPHGSCWFSALPGGDGCAAVLRGAHRVG